MDSFFFFQIDFRPAVNNLTPLTPNQHSQSRASSTNSNEEALNDEMTSLYQQYKIIAEKNRERLHRLIEIESNNQIKLTELLNTQQNNSPK